MSGGAIGDGLAASNSAFTNLAQQVGCANLSPTAELACMQQVDVSVLQWKIQNVTATTGGFGFSYIVDNVTVFANSTDRLEKGLVAKEVIIFPCYTLLAQHMP